MTCLKQQYWQKNKFSKTQHITLDETKIKAKASINNLTNQEQ